LQCLIREDFFSTIKALVGVAHVLLLMRETVCAATMLFRAYRYEGVFVFETKYAFIVATLLRKKEPPRKERISRFVFIEKDGQETEEEGVFKAMRRILFHRLKELKS
jgi:hypothetical protein